MFDTFFNIAAVIVIVGAPLMWIAGWIMLIYKADRFIHRQFEPPPPKTTPKELGEALANYLDELKEMGLPPPTEPMDVLARRFKENLVHHAI